MKNFVKAMDRTSPAFRYLYEKFPRLSEEKIIQGVFEGPQIRELFKDDRFNNSSCRVMRDKQYSLFFKVSVSIKVLLCNIFPELISIMNDVYMYKLKVCAYSMYFWKEHLHECALQVLLCPLVL